MAYGRRRGLDPGRILTLGDTVPRSVGGILIAMLVVTVATILSPPLWVLLCLDPGSIASGEIWRLATWVFPQGDAITLLFAGLVLYWLGKDLANSWSERHFLRVFFGYAVWAAAWTTLAALIWRGADRPYVGAWPVVNALLVGWAFARPGAQLRLFFVLPVTAQVFGWLIVGGTVLFAISSPHGAGEYVPHLSALAGALLLHAGITPRRLWLRAKQSWYAARLRRSRGRSHLRSVKKDDGPRWMN